jgi:hypothetical protein
LVLIETVLKHWNFRPEIPKAIVIKARTQPPRIFNELIKSRDHWRSLAVEWRSGGLGCWALSANVIFRRSTDLHDPATHSLGLTNH